uniref:Uncharacterized protein n=1 Tax=Anguilla anguilla TaxID=7936 RepID=A0A0E9VJH2_ANGAN
MQGIMGARNKVDKRHHTTVSSVQLI